MRFARGASKTLQKLIIAANKQGINGGNLIIRAHSRTRVLFLTRDRHAADDGSEPHATIRVSKCSGDDLQVTRAGSTFACACPSSLAGRLTESRPALGPYGSLCGASEIGAASPLRAAIGLARESLRRSSFASFTLQCV